MLSTALLFVFQLEYPVFWTVDEFCEGFIRLIDHLELTKVCKLCQFSNVLNY